MAGYVSNWDCRICCEHQETIDSPKLRICNDCLDNLAEALCNIKLSHSIKDPGIDREYWRTQAWILARALFKNWVPKRPSEDTPVVVAQQPTPAASESVRRPLEGYEQVRTDLPCQGRCGRPIEGGEMYVGGKDNPRHLGC